MSLNKTWLGNDKISEFNIIILYVVRYKLLNVQIWEVIINVIQTKRNKF